MTGKLILKELKLALHPTAYIFMALSAMLLIPNYPYYVVFFYTGLAVFFTCLSGRENNDIYYTLLLPVPKSAAVKARFISVSMMEGAQLLIAAVFAVLRNKILAAGNDAGMDANIALFGLSLVFYGIFNLVFFTKYYKDVNKVGSAFVWASAAVFLYIAAAEVCCHTVPFFIAKLDTPDPQFLKEKLIVLAAGAAVYALMTALAYKKSVKSFERQDI